MAVRLKYLWMCLVLGTMLKNSDGACSYTEVTSKAGNSADISGGIRTVSNIQECKDECTTATTYACEAARYHTTNTVNNCVFLGKVQEPPYGEDDNQYILLLKTCSPCSMTRSENTKGGDTRVQLTLTSADQCGSACLYVEDCTGVAYSGGNCNIYTGTTSATNTGDDLTLVKTSCSGKQCCMSGTETEKASVAALVTLASNLNSCETACLMSSNCHSLYFRNNVCYIYQSAQDKTSEPGSTFSEKSCTETPTYDITFTEMCYGAGGSKPTQGVMLVVYLMLLMNNLV